ncbi:hypothetical protein HU200_063268 [Digitaria exilis]|uniref:Uncharacterized protein n=1 Tax=Digitaria exilis TaxID=1010633 RepID=A0A835DWJ9_9POAL|nr:hypothetical protein HU200_063268 [Digitaria exilis]
MAAAGGAGGSSPSGTKTKKLKIAVIHPDLGIDRIILMDRATFQEETLLTTTAREQTGFKDIGGSQFCASSGCLPSLNS